MTSNLERGQQNSFSTLANVEISLNDPNQRELGEGQSVLKPRGRSVGYTRKDTDDGLEILIQKTKICGLRQGEEGLLENENGNEWLNALSSRERLLWGVTKIRKFVCGGGSDAHVEELIQAKVLERLLYFMDFSTEHAALFEILWIVTNIAAGPTAHTTCLVEANYLGPLGTLLTHPQGNIRTQAAWAIGNIIGDREGYRDKVLQARLLPDILQIHRGNHIDYPAQMESLRISMWIVDNMCRYKPDWQLMKPAFDIIPQILQEQEHAILKECCWAVARILHQSGRHPEIDAMITPSLCARLIQILDGNNPLTSHPVLRALINLTSSKNKIHLKYLDDGDLLAYVGKYVLRKQEPRYGSKDLNSFDIFVVQILGNLAVDPQFAVKISHRPRVCEWMVQTFGTPTNTPTQKELRTEICITLRNMLYHRLPSVSAELAKHGLIDNLHNYLDQFRETNNRFQLFCLESLGNLAATVAEGYHPQIRYSEIMKANHPQIFSTLLEIYKSAAGHSIDKMDQDDDFDDLDDYEEDLSDDDDDEMGGRGHHNKGGMGLAGSNFSSSQATIPFDSTNPYSHAAKSGKGLKDIKMEVKNQVVQLLRTHYPLELTQSISTSQNESQVMELMNVFGLSGGPPAADVKNDSVSDLTGFFNNMSPTK